MGKRTRVKGGHSLQFDGGNVNSTGQHRPLSLQSFFQHFSHSHLGEGKTLLLKQSEQATAQSKTMTQPGKIKEGKIENKRFIQGALVLFFKICFHISFGASSHQRCNFKISV